MRTIIIFLALGCADKADTTDTGPTGSLPGMEEEVDCSTRSTEIPSTRGEVEGVWDTARERFVFFGGDQGPPESCIPKPDFLDEVWAFHPDCDNFERITPEGDGPSPRTRHSITMDHSRGRMLMHGGRSREGTSGPYDIQDDLWAYDLATDTWQELPSNDGPRARVTHSMVVAGDQMIVYGGNSTSSSTSYVPMADVWSYDLVSERWERLDADAAAGKRLFHAAAISDDGKTMYVFGGADDNAYTGPFFSDLWSYDVSSGLWTELDEGSGPLGRIMPDLLFDGERNRLLLWSGHDDGNLGNTNEMWAWDLDGSGWTQIEDGDSYENPAFGFCNFPADFVDPDLNAPERRYFGAGAMSEDDIYIFGGKTDCGQVNDVWMWSLRDEEWTERSPATSGEVCLRSFADGCESLCF